MARKPNDDERRRIKREYKLAELAAAQAAMILDRTNLDALREHVDARLAETPCDHSLRLTLAWAGQHGVDRDALTASVRHFGGYCDCEVVDNVDSESIFGRE